MQPWLVHLAGVLLTAAAAYLAARRGARETTQDRAQREAAAAREEWFRRVQWAAELTLRSDNLARAAGLALLDSLAESKLATDDDLDLIRAINDDAFLDRLSAAYAITVDQTVFVTENEADASDSTRGEQ